MSRPTELTLNIQALGLNAIRADLNMPPTPGSIMMTGHFITINEGNTLQRAAIGFDLGHCSIGTEVSILVPVGAVKHYQSSFAEEANHVVKDLTQ